jgi:hypothetical protein
LPRADLRPLQRPTWDRFKLVALGQWDCNRQEFFQQLMQAHESKYDELSSAVDLDAYWMQPTEDVQEAVNPFLSNQQRSKDEAAEARKQRVDRRRLLLHQRAELRQTTHSRGHEAEDLDSS